MNIPYVFKKCTKCGKWLVASSINFYKAKRGKYGLYSKCKKCVAEYNKENKEAIAEYKRQWYQDNKEAINERNKQYYQDNKEAIADYSKKYNQDNKEAIAERKKQYQQENKEAIAEYNRQWRGQNKENIAEYMKQYYQDNKESLVEYNRQYYQSPQGQIARFNNASRRRAKEQAQGNGITKEQWLECMSFFNWQCAYSGEYLGGKDNQSIRSLDHIEPLNKGGANEVYNMVPMYKPYNSSKHDKDLLEWYTEQPYFSQDRLDKIYEWQEYAYSKWGIDTEAQ